MYRRQTQSSLPSSSNPRGLTHVHLLLQFAVQVGRLDVHLVDLPVTGGCLSEQQPKRCEFDHWRERLVREVVFAHDLAEALRDEPTL